MMREMCRKLRRTKKPCPERGHRTGLVRYVLISERRARNLAAHASRCCLFTFQRLVRPPCSSGLRPSQRLLAPARLTLAPNLGSPARSLPVGLLDQERLRGLCYWRRSREASEGPIPLLAHLP